MTTFTLTSKNAFSFISSLEKDMKGEFLFALLGVHKISSLALTPESFEHICVLKDCLGTIVREQYSITLKEFVNDNLVPFIIGKPKSQIVFSNKDACRLWVLKQFAKWLSLPWAQITEFGLSGLIDYSDETETLHNAIVFLYGYTEESLGIIPMF